MKDRANGMQQPQSRPSRPPAERLLDDLLEAAQTAALALLRLRDGDSLSGLHAHLLQVS